MELLYAIPEFRAPAMELLGGSFDQKKVLQGCFFDVQEKKYSKEALFIANCRIFRETLQLRNPTRDFRYDMMEQIASVEDLFNELFC